MKNKNIVIKGEVACYKQFLLFSQCFQQPYTLIVLKWAIVWSWVKNLTKNHVICV